MAPISSPAAASTTIQSPTNGAGVGRATAANASASAHVKRATIVATAAGAPGRERDERRSERRGGDDADGEYLATSHGAS